MSQLHAFTLPTLKACLARLREEDREAGLDEAAVLAVLARQSATTTADIAAQTGIAPAALTSLLDLMMELELVTLRAGGLVGLGSKGEALSSCCS